MPVTATVSESRFSAPQLSSSPKNRETCSLLIESIKSVATPPIEFNRAASVTGRQATESCQGDDETHTLAGEEEAVFQDEQQAKSTHSLWWWSGAALTGILAGAVGIGVWRHLHNTADTQNKNALSTSPFDSDSPQAAGLEAEKVTTSSTILPKKTNTARRQRNRQKKKSPICMQESARQRCKDKWQQHAQQNKKILFISDNGATCSCPQPADDYKREKRIYDLNENKKRQSTTTALPPKDDVLSVKMFDTLCAENRSNLQFTDWLRIFSRASKNPFTSFYKEYKILHNYVFEGLGCPDEKDMETPIKIFQGVDYVFTAVLGFLPGSQPAVVLQNIISPAVDMLADELDGIPVDPEKLTSLNQQLLFMMRQTIPTLSAKEQTSLYNQPTDETPVRPGNQRIFDDRFIVQKGQLMVVVERQHYPLQEMSDGTPFIIDENHRPRLIRYDNMNKHWVYITTEEVEIYSAENLKNRDTYGISLENLPEGYRIIAEKDHEMLTIKVPGQTDITGVFVEGIFIPAIWVNIRGMREAVTNTPGQKERRILLYTSLGWKFERASAKMDKHLKRLLNDAHQDKHLAIKYQAGGRIASINDALGFSHSETDGDLIKNDNKYYKTQDIYTREGDPQRREVTGYPYSAIKYDHGILTLTQRDDAPFALRNVKETASPNTSASFKIEAGTLNYLLRHAKKTTSTPGESSEMGISVTTKGEIIFTFKNKNYAARKYTSDEIHIKRDNDSPSEDIILWRDGDTWLRKHTDLAVKEIDYADYATCRAERSPGRATGCIPIMIENDLHNLLAQHIEKQTTCNVEPNPEDLSPSNLFQAPVVYQDTKTMNYYFTHQGRYFDAEIIAADDKQNLTKLPCLRISAKGNYFTKKKHIADILIERQNNKYYIKTQQAFFAEKVNIDKDTAGDYLASRPYRDVDKIDTLEELVDEVRQSGKIYIAKPHEVAGLKKIPPTYFTEQLETAKHTLFPKRISRDVERFYMKAFALNADRESLNPFENQAAQHVKSQFKYANEQILDQLISSIDYETYPWSYITPYFKEAFKNSEINIQFQTDFAHKLRQSFLQMKKAFNENNIYLVTAREKEGTEALSRSQSLLMQEERQSGETSWMSIYDDGRIFINIDKLDLSDAMQNSQLTDPITTLIYAATHTKGMSSDFFKIAKENGVYPPLDNAIKMLVEKLRTNTLTPEELKVITEVNNRYLNEIFAYHRNPARFLTSDSFAYLVENDPGYLAHLLANSSDFMTLITLDLKYRMSMSDNDFSANRLDSWIRKYGIAREDIPKTPSEIAISPAKLEIARLTKTILEPGSVKEVSGKKNIFYSSQDLDLFIKSEENYYPVEFIGWNNNIIFVGPSSEARQVYHYEPASGEIKPARPNALHNDQFSWNRDVDLYISKNTETGQSVVLKFNDETKQLVETGATKVVPMLENVIKIEFPDFDLFTTENASPDVYLAAHGSHQLNLKKNLIPKNINVNFYTGRGRILHGHVDDLVELVNNKIAVKESKPGGSLLEEYDVYFDDGSKINYHQLAKSSAKNLLRVKPTAKATSSEIIDAVAKLFPSKPVNLYLYICRSI